jgi:hypothetical protein
MPFSMSKSTLELRGKRVTPKTKIQRTEPLDAMDRAIKRWFYQPDLQAVRVMLGTTNAHL